MTSKPEDKKKLMSKRSRNRRDKSKHDEVSSDEEKWLEAIEAGEYEKINQINPKDQKSMTVRQRAKYDPNITIEPLLALPSGYKEKDLSAEGLKKAALISERRKQKYAEKREKEMAKTVEKILKNVAPTKTRKNSNFKPKTDVTPLMSLKMTADLTTLSIHPDLPCPIENKVAKEPPKPVFCGMNCGNLKKYSCSKTGVPLCSLECYRKNLSLRSRELNSD